MLDFKGRKKRKKKRKKKIKKNLQKITKDFHIFYVSEALRANVIIGYFGFKKTNFCRKNIVDNLILKHCYLYVVFYYLKMLLSAVEGIKTFF